jgi:hypothetical protein
MNMTITDQDAQSAIANLNILYGAASAVPPSGLVPEAAKAQAEAVQNAAVGIQEFVQKTREPVVASDNFTAPIVGGGGKLEHAPPETKAAKSK